MSKEFWYETWEILEEEATEKFVELYGKEPTEQQIKEYCDTHIEDRVKDRYADAIDNAKDAYENR